MVLLHNHHELAYFDIGSDGTGRHEINGLGVSFKVKKAKIPLFQITYSAK
jgi:hypothetical protein